MKVKLISHVNRDGDLLEAWFRYYLRLGVSSFHLIVHGPRSENARLFAIKDSFPVTIADCYEGEFRSEEKKRRLDALMATMPDQWVMLADSDEFVELPYRRVSTTIRALDLARANMLYAPMLQHLTLDGSLETPEIIADPFRTFPLCSIELYQKMGSKATLRKYPLFYCARGITLSDGGNHDPLRGGPHPALSSLLGITHHFKFRRSVRERLDARIDSAHSWRHESLEFRTYLDGNGGRLPLEDSFPYSRSEMFRRGLLRRFSFRAALRSIQRVIRRTDEIGPPKALHPNDQREQSR